MIKRMDKACTRGLQVNNMSVSTRMINKMDKESSHLLMVQTTSDSTRMVLGKDKACLLKAMVSFKVVLGRMFNF